MVYCCSEHDCGHEAKYVCRCSEDYLCKYHLKKHLVYADKNHFFDFISSELSDIAKDGILKFLTQEKLKKEKLQNIALSVLQIKKKQNISINKQLNELSSDLSEINDLIMKISQISENEQVSLLNTYYSYNDSDPKRALEMLQNCSDNNIMLFYRLGELKNKKLAILSKANNNFETEQDFRKTCAFYENNASNWPLNQAYKEYTKAYQKISSLYHVNKELFIFDTESEREWKETWEYRDTRFEHPGFITQLPNTQWFVYLFNGEEGIEFILDRNYAIRRLQSGECFNYSTVTYFNRSIYCFGYEGYQWEDEPSSTRRFDLDKNIWVKLAPIENHDHYGWRSLVFNRNILISRVDNRNLLLYSIDIDSFSAIPYEFERIPYKILINVEERLYLIECGKDSWIYESEVGNEYTWNKISKSIIQLCIWNGYFSYNKGAFYILIHDCNFREYLKFDLDKKDLTEIACYRDGFALKRSDGKLKLIDSECYDKNFKLESDYIKNGFTLYDIAEKLSKIKKLDFIIKNNPRDDSSYVTKGDILYDLDWNLEAIECYNKAIQLESENPQAYIRKGDILYELDRDLEALECYSKAAKLKSKNPDVYFKKAILLHNLSQYLEAMKSFNKAIKLKPDEIIYIFYRASLFNDLGQEEKAIQDFNRAYSYLKYNYYLKSDSFNDNLKSDSDLSDSSSSYFSESDSYGSTDSSSELTIKHTELIEKLSKLLEIAVKVKEELQKLKDLSLKNPEIYNEIVGKVSIVQKQRSSLIKRAVECLDQNKTNELIEQIKKDVSENQKVMIDILAELHLLISSQEQEDTTKIIMS